MKNVATFGGEIAVEHAFFHLEFLAVDVVGVSSVRKGGGEIDRTGTLGDIDDSGAFLTAVYEKYVAI